MYCSLFADDCPLERESCNDVALCAEDGCGHGTCVRTVTRNGFWTVFGRECECDEGWESSTCELGRYTIVIMLIMLRLLLLPVEHLQVL